MQPREREALEQLIRELCRQGDVGGAVETALAGYGTELPRLMGSILKDPERTREAFSELLVKDLPAFRWQSSFRTWAYQLARRHSAVGAAREVPVTRDAFAQEVCRRRAPRRSPGSSPPSRRASGVRARGWAP